MEIESYLVYSEENNFSFANISSLLCRQTQLRSIYQTTETAKHFNKNLSFGE